MAITYIPAARAAATPAGPRRRVLYHQAVFRPHPQLARHEQIDLRVGLAVLDIVARCDDLEGVRESQDGQLRPAIVSLLLSVRIPDG
jgi:hypothetical protein